MGTTYEITERHTGKRVAVLDCSNGREIVAFGRAHAVTTRTDEVEAYEDTLRELGAAAWDEDGRVPGLRVREVVNGRAIVPVEF